MSIVATQTSCNVARHRHLWQHVPQGAVHAAGLPTLCDLFTHTCRFLKAGGALLPDIATLHTAGVGPSAGGLHFWSSVYGFDMSPVASTLREAALRDAVVAHVRPEDLVTPPVQLHSFDLATMTPSDADFTADFQIQANDQQVCDVGVSCCTSNGALPGTLALLTYHQSSPS